MFNCTKALSLQAAQLREKGLTFDPLGSIASAWLQSVAMRKTRAGRAVQLIEERFATALSARLFLDSLLRHSPTLEFLKDALKCHASQDEAFAALVTSEAKGSTVKTATPRKRGSSKLSHGIVPRSLLPEFDEIPTKAAKLEAMAAVLDPLPLVLAAQVSSFLNLREKLLFLASNRQARTFHRNPSAWQPLVLDADDCAQVLRSLRSLDPRGILEPKFYPSPVCAAWEEVTEVRVELMEPDRPDTVERPHFRRASTLSKVVLDPIEEFARRLSVGWFAGATQLHLMNIEVDRMDTCFLEFRLKAFGRFSRLTLQPDGLDPSRCRLHACCSTVAFPSVADGFAMERERFPTRPEAQPLFAWPEQITAPEALFLREHSLMVKTGSLFRNIQKPWHFISEVDVKEHYDRLCAMHERPA